MKKYFIPLFLLFFPFLANAQGGHGFAFGQTTYRDLEMKVYDKDTAAAAVVLSEFGEAYISNSGDHNLFFEYHVKIKILKKSGLKYADVEIPLWKQDGVYELLHEVKASSFTFENGSMKETPLSKKNIFTVNRSESLDIKKFAIPNVREGSVIEFQFTLESPFIYNFRSWEFQSDIPKVISEYWTLIPANYVYNITLRGFYELTKNENELVKECFQPGPYTADCVRSRYAIKDIPAFVEEDFMTARSNFVSAINFELSEVRYFDGRVDKKTKEWKDAEDELRRHQEFGLQLKRGKEIAGHVEMLVAGETDPLLKAKKIYAFIRDWFRWDERYSKYSELGIKKAFDQKTGNVGDINLSLIAALRHAGLDVEPVILSTRANGLPIELHPVLSDFNYVVAKVNIGDKVYLADATDDFYPFGLLPERCLNGKGRVLGEEKSYWIELEPADRAKHISLLTLKLEDNGIMHGTIQTTYTGYEAVKKRKEIYSFSNYQEYIRDLDNNLNRINIKDFELRNTDDLEKPLIEKLEIETRVFDDTTIENFLFNPFIIGKWQQNPFRSKERVYPVDFGKPMEFISILTLEYPEHFEIAYKPEKTGLALPNAGGRYICDVQNTGNKLSLNSALTISKTIFTSTEYHYLKELFTRIIQIENGDLVFKKKV